MKPCITSEFIYRGDSRQILDTINTFEVFKAHGFCKVDFNLASVNFGTNRDTFYDGDYKENFALIKQVMDESGVSCSCCHPPFYHYMTIADDDLDYMREMTFKSLDAAKILGAPWAVFHPAVKNNVTYVEQSIEGIKPYLEYANSLGLGVAVENGFSTDAEQMLEIIQGLGGKDAGVGACWDTGHGNLKFGNQNKRNQYQSITTLGEFLKVIHVHDNFGDNDAHSLPGCGNIDWKSVSKALNDVDFVGDFNFEVSSANIPFNAREGALDYLNGFAQVMINNAI